MPAMRATTKTIPLAPIPPPPPSAPASQRNPPITGQTPQVGGPTTGPVSAQPGQLTYPSPGQQIFPQSLAAVITVHYPQPGTTLNSPKGSYVVRQVLGSGEFGAVYET